MRISEEPTQDNIQQLIDKLPASLSPVERMLLCHDGTVQTALSILFRVPVKIEVLSQYSLPEDQVIVRWVRQVAEYSPGDQTTVCLAESVIPIKKNPPGFITGITEKFFGIGQLIKSLNLTTHREIQGVYGDSDTIARNYLITGDCFLLITETFSRHVLKKADSVT